MVILLLPSIAKTPALHADKIESNDSAMSRKVQAVLNYIHIEGKSKIPLCAALITLSLGSSTEGMSCVCTLSSRSTSIVT